MNRRGLTLLEVLLAVVLLAAIVVACLPLLAPASGGQDLGRSDPVLTAIAESNQIAPSNIQISEELVPVGEEITGTWRVVVSPGGYGIAWVASEAGGGP